MKDMNSKNLKTQYRARKIAMHEAVYQEYTKLMALPDASQQAVYKHLMKKYKIYSPSTIYYIRKKYSNLSTND